MLLPSAVTILASSTTSVLKNVHTRSFAIATCTRMSQVKEIIIPCSDGIELAAKHWSSLPTKENTKKDRILLLHGWLDNAASFDLLAPKLNCVLNAEIVALDLPGHGFSSHKSLDGPLQLISEYSYYVSEALTSLGWHSDAPDADSRTTIVGHSMGAAIALIYAAAFPEQCSRLVLLEGAGPLARDPSDITKHVRSSITRRLKSNKILFPDGDGDNSKNNDGGNKKNGRKRIYKNLQLAIAARKKTADLVPGNQYISTEAAAAVVHRAAIPAEALSAVNFSKAGGEELSSTYEGPVVFRHDARLTWPSLAYFSKDQIAAIYRDVQCPTFLCLADDGWPDDEWAGDAVKNILQPSKFIKLPGSHHFHLDPDSADKVIDSVIEFLAS